MLGFSKCFCFQVLFGVTKNVPVYKICSLIQDNRNFKKIHASKFALEFRKLFPFSKLFNIEKIMFLKQMFPNLKINSKNVPNFEYAVSQNVCTFPKKIMPTTWK